LAQEKKLMQVTTANPSLIKRKSDITIRPIINQDKEKIFHLLKQRGTFNKKEIEVAIEVIEDALAGPENGYYIFCAVKETSDVAGFICFGPIPLTEGCYDLYWIAVDETFSRHGVGKKLLATMEHFVINEEGRQIYIDTSSTEPYLPARSFYQTNGYRIATVLHDFYRQGDNKVIFMKNI
jgi:ribosomal protein S18 acetylase RimI-like enzyme